MGRVFDVQKNVNPHFKSVWQTDKSYNVLKGGRNSFKSSVIALKLVYDLLPFLIKGEKANIVVIRKVANTIRDSVFNKMQWALDKFNLSERFKATVSPFKITDTYTQSTIYFYGQDDFQKLKSNDIGSIIAVWYEEAAEFNSFEEFDQSNITFMRQKHKDVPFVKFYWSYNPPRNPYNWINEWVDTVAVDSNYLVHSSSYLNDELGFVTEQMLQDIERVKQNDNEYYRYIYLGEPVGFANHVYNINLFQKIEEIPSDDKLLGISFGLDTGHQQSATACVAVGITAKSKAIVLDTFYYNPSQQREKAAPSELSVMINQFVENVLDRYNVQMLVLTIDSAEGALRNQFYHDFGIRWHPVAKKKNQTMIDMVCTLLAKGQVYYLPTENNKIFYEEHKMYRYDDKTLNTDEPKVIKENDHSVDAFKYFVLDNTRLLGLER